MNNDLNQNQLLSNIDFNIFLKQSKDNITYSSGLNLSKNKQLNKFVYSLLIKLHNINTIFISYF